MMRKIFGIAAIILIASGYAAGADYWHFGIGTRIEGVKTSGKDYHNALGGGLLLTFGNPDSRFTTQFDLDKWGVTYHINGDLVRTNSVTEPTPTYKVRDRNYSGLGVGMFERYRAFDFTDNYSAYVIGGIGGYFLDYKEEMSDNGVVTLKSKGLHSLGQLAGGIGFEGRFDQHILGFIEGRFVGFLNAQKTDKNLMKGYLGIRYIF
jgi:hypothetical protein